MKKFFFHYFSPIFFFTAFLFLIYSLPFLQIKNINIAGTKYSDQEFILSIINDELNGRYFYLLNKRNILFYPQEKIINNILNSNKRIKSVQISSQNFWRNLEFQITERVAAYLWCKKNAENQETENQATEQCFFVDKAGVIFYAFDEAKTTKKEAEFIKIYGNIILEQFIDVTKIINFLNYNNLKVQKIIFDEFGNLMIVINGKTKILLAGDFSAQNIIHKLSVIFTYQDFLINETKKSFQKKINYINLKHGNKIFYCLNDVRCANNH